MAETPKNPFEQLNQQLRDVPPEMRKKVMRDVAIAKLVMDMAILVTSNYGSLITSLFKTNRKN